MEQTFTEQLEALRLRAEQSIEKAIKERGVESKWMHETVIPITENEFNFNMDGDRYLAEISYDKLIDSSGYDYEWGMLAEFEICRLADHITPKNDD